jgi:glycosyltransferase involved in cell wall biosynthesis
VGFDPQAPVTLDDAPRLRLKNSINLLAFDSADWGLTATRWQAALYPLAMRRRISVIHEGIDTAIACPGEISLQIPGCDQVLTRADEVITFITRNLEPYRGFHVFMRALPEIQRRRPNVRVLIVGGDEVSYGPPAPPGTNFRQMMLDEVGAQLDRSRVHFLGKVPYARFLDILRLSSVHIHLTFPFVLSWSLLEALSSGCLVIASDVPSVKEAITDRRNGLLVDFFDQAGLCDRIDEVLGHPDRMQSLREVARRTVIERFDLHSVTLPRQLRLIEAVQNRWNPRQINVLRREPDRKKTRSTPRTALLTHSD